MKKVISTIIASAVAVSSFGAWSLIDDFNAYNDGDIFTDATEIGWNASSEAGTDEYWFLADPYDAENISLYVESGNYGVGNGNVWAVKALPGGGIAPGATGTIFFRNLWSGLGNNWHIGTADKPLAFDDVTGNQTAPGAWGDYNALIRLGDAKNVEHRDGGGYVSTNPPVVVTTNIWYSFWMVIENTWDMTTTPPTSTGVHTLYMQGEGIGDVPTLIPVGTDPAKDSAFIRRAPTDDDGNPANIIWCMFASNSGSAATPNPGDPYLLDDIYYSAGMNLTNPLEASTSWGGYPIANDAGDVDTGDWLGWINVSAAPYIFSYSLGWIYMTEPDAAATGSWGYVFK
jgi:hypothetical protein